MIALLGRHFTFDTYGHVLKRAKHEAARIMDQVVGGKF